MQAFLPRRRFLGWLATFMAAPLFAAEKTARIVRRKVDSTSLASGGYDAAGRVMELEFRSGAIYRYREVPEAVFRELMRSDSKGKYFTKKIRGKYAYERVDSRAQ